MIEIVPDLTKQNILSKVSDLDIFRYYCKNFSKPGEKFSSEFRKDSNPSCIISNYNGNIYFKDFGDTEGTLSCFDYVMKKYNVDFYTALCIINRDFNLRLDGKEITTHKSEKKAVIKNEQYDKISTGKSIIRVHYKEWDQKSIDYIESYKLDYQRVSNKFNVNPIDYFWLNGLQFKAADVAFAYYFGLDNNRYIYKIYQPLEKKYKWFHNLNPTILQGWSQLPESGDLLLLSKGYKDVWCFDNFNINALAPGAEGWDIPDKVMDNLFERFNHVVCQYDFDYAGIKGMNHLKRRYNLKCIPITNGRFKTIDYKSKDFSDYCKTNTIETIHEEINRVKYKFNLT